MSFFWGFRGFLLAPDGRKLRQLKPYEQLEVNRLWAKHADIRTGNLVAERIYTRHADIRLDVAEVQRQME